MKGFVIIFLAVCLAFTAESAGHNKKHKASKNIKDEALMTEPDAVTWPSPPTIGDFGVPDKFQEDTGSEEDEEKSVKHRGRSSRKSH